MTRSNNGSGAHPLIGVPCARDKSQRHYGLPVLIQNQTYVQAVAEAGGAPIIIPLQMEEEMLRVIFDNLDGVFLSGGEDLDPASYNEEPHELLGAVDPERDRVELTMARWALAEGRPLLAVCRGMQVLNVALGGTLYQDIRAQRGAAVRHDFFPPEFERFRISHDVQIDGGSLLGGIFERRAQVNSMHHQGIKTLGTGCRVSAWAPDGIIEALDIPEHPFALAVQWHPEELALRLNNRANRRLFSAFVEECR